MAESIARVRMTRRWNNLMAGDIAVFPLSTANNLVATRFAEALPPPAGVQIEGEAQASPLPQRQPAPIVRK
jgi:hypothetical protein